MQILTLDFETFFTDERDPATGLRYELRGMTTESYIRHPWFEAHGAGIRWPLTGRTEWFVERDLRNVLQDIDWSNTALLAHHAAFDGLILSHHYNVRPAFWFCTFSMASLMLGNHVRVGLDSLAKLFGLQPKTVPYNYFKGRHWDQITSDVQQLVAEGCCHDCDLTWDIFGKLMTGRY